MDYEYIQKYIMGRPTLLSQPISHDATKTMNMKKADYKCSGRLTVTCGTISTWSIKTTPLPHYGQ